MFRSQINGGSLKSGVPQPINGGSLKSGVPQPINGGTLKSKSNQKRDDDSSLFLKGKIWDLDYVQ